MGVPNTRDRAYLIDASIFIFRYYFSLPDYWHSQDGYSTFAVRGYVSWLAKFLVAENPNNAVACFDESLGSCFRNDIYPDYKVSRAPADDELIFQLEACKQMTELLGVATYASERYEADDLLGTIAQRCIKKGLAFCLLTRDKDLGQLVEPTLSEIWDYPDGVRMDSIGVVERFGVQPNQIADYLAIVGDVSDDIPGVPGVGSKTAVKLLTYFGSWSNLRENLDEVVNTKIRGAKRLVDKLAEHREQVDMALALTTIARDAKLGRRFKISRSKVDITAAQKYSEYLGLNLNLKKTLGQLEG